MTNLMNDKFNKIPRIHVTQHQHHITLIKSVDRWSVAGAKTFQSSLQMFIEFYFRQIYIDILIFHSNQNQNVQTQRIKWINLNHVVLTEIMISDTYSYT